MPNPENLKSFTSENQPEKRGRVKGVKNRATVLKKWLEAKTEITNPITKKKQKGTVEDEVILSLITQARKGNVKATALILDSLYGKVTQKLEHSGTDGKPIETNQTVNLKVLSTDELLKLKEIQDKLKNA